MIYGRVLGSEGVIEGKLKIHFDPNSTTLEADGISEWPHPTPIFHHLSCPGRKCPSVFWGTWVPFLPLDCLESSPTLSSYSFLADTSTWSPFHETGNTYGCSFPIPVFLTPCLSWDIGTRLVQPSSTLEKSTTCLYPVRYYLRHLRLF